MKSIIITGGNSGIGFECALQMARLAPNEQIIITSRNIESGNEAIKSIKSKTSHQHLKCMPLDVASLNSIKEFVDIFSKEEYNQIISLINNAGGKTSDHCSIQLMVLKKLLGLTILADLL